MGAVFVVSSKHHFKQVVVPKVGFSYFLLMHLLAACGEFLSGIFSVTVSDAPTVASFKPDNIDTDCLTMHWQHYLNCTLVIVVPV